jgi:DNA invertase Pin-like site-specific DNA recombinase
LRELPETVDQLKARAIGLVSIEEKIDTSSAARELVFHVFGAIAHFERRLIAERTRDGRAAAAANSRCPGRNPLDPEKLEAFAPIDAGAVGIGRSTPMRRRDGCPSGGRVGCQLRDCGHHEQPSQGDT